MTDGGLKLAWGSTFEAADVCCLPVALVGMIEPVGEVEHWRRAAMRSGSDRRASVHCLCTGMDRIGEVASELV